MEKILNYIEGELIEPQSNEYLDNTNPANGEVYSLVPKSNAKDAELAIEAASRAFTQWSGLSKTERAEYLLKIAELIEENFEALALAETRDNGKPLKTSRMVDIPRSKENIEFFANEIHNFNSQEFDNQGAGDNTVSYEPLGVVTCISPWNLPLYLLTWKIAPALISGCTVVAKPSEVTPMTAFLFSKICIQAGLPEGVLNIVHGLGGEVGDVLTRHPAVQAVSFTGSTATGKIIARNCAETMKRVHLEMGGKNPNIIFADCDFEKALSTTMRSSFANQGQICLCGSRIFVERPIYEEFKIRFIDKILKLRQGNPEDESVHQGAVVSKDHYEKILSCLDVAKKEGGRFLTGGAAVKMEGEFSNGFYISPTLIEGLPFNCETNQTEIFGPVATIMPFDLEEQVISYANSTEYGLSATIWTEDKVKAKRVASQVKSGIVWINTWLLRDLRTPFGGMKESGRGREGGLYILKFFSNIKNICFG
ncbi:MAG: aldehyde dehydrogenase [Bacteriovoracaceae bacterium]|nr:aldehyde dehydrogenase [Bacteriovoracaceae bacterium]